MRLVSSASQKARWKKCVWFALVSLAFAPLLSAVTLVHDFYLPMPEAQIKQTFDSLETGVGTALDSTFSVVVTGDGTVVYYDQWEDGYETDLAHPTQASTQVWGDGNNLNGIAPGFVNDPQGLPAGTALTLRNLVPLPRNPSNLLFDGRDRVAATKALVVSRMAWPTSPGSVLADAVQVPATIDYGTNYVSPVGQDLTNAMFQYVGLFVMAGSDNTSVTIDPDGSGPTAPITVVLNRGESYLVNGGIAKGASVTATKLVQAELVVGKKGARYASDWFGLTPVSDWGSSYVTPVPTPDSGNTTYVYLYNPANTNLTVNYTTRVSSGSFTVASNGVYQFAMPKSSGARFTSAGGGNFFALSTVAASPGNEAPYDWGFTLLATDNLTTEAVVGLGLGSGDGTQNGSPVWLSPLAATRVYVDYNGDHNGLLTDPNGNKYDTNFDLVALQSQKIYDPDKDQTGMRLYTLDGTLFSTAWGEDADVASSGNPFIDAGTTVLPFPTPVLTKTSTIFTDVGATGLSIGDVIEYTITLDNRGLLPLGNTVLIDAPPTNIAYVANSTSLDGNPISDNGSGTAFPLDAPAGYTIPIILRNGTTMIKFRATVLSAGTISNSVNALGYNLGAQNVVVPPPAGGATSCALDFTDAAGTSVVVYTAGGTIYVKVTDGDANTATNSSQTMSVVVSNATRGDFELVTLTETGNNTGIFRNAGGLPASVSAGLGQQDGTLNAVAGDTLTVKRTDPVYGDVCNASATVSAPARNKILYLSTDGSGSPDQDLDRVDPVATADATTAQSVTLGSSGGSSVIGVSSTSANGSAANATSLTIAHTVGSGPNRLMVVGVALSRSGGIGAVSVTNVTYGGTALTKLVSVQDTGSTIRSRDEIWYLTNAPSGTANVVIGVSTAQGISAGVVTFTNVNLAAPFGTAATNQNGGNVNAATLTVTSATNELVFASVAVDGDGTAQTIAAGAGQTQSWETNAASNQAHGAASTRTGATSSTNTWSWTGTSQQYAVAGVSIKPAAGGGGGGTNFTTFTQIPAFCQNFVMPSNGVVTITNFVTITSGSMPTSPAITAQLKYGSTNVITLTNAAYNSSAGTLIWSGAFGATNTTIPAGATLALVLTNAQAGVSYTIDYDSSTKPSRIALPASSVIHINTLGIYDAPYPGGNLVSTPVVGTTLYVRVNVNDPFGSYDIASLGLSLDGPGATGDINTTLTNSSVVANDGCAKTYEYVWNTGTAGGFTITATANEGTEGITDVSAASVTLIVPDTGTPSTAQFTSGNNGVATNAFPASGTVCIRVTDLDKNTNSATPQTITAIVTSSSGDSETISLTETGTNSGTFTACLAVSTNAAVTNNNGVLTAPVSSVLTVTYTDPNDVSDQSTATATVIPAPGTPRVTMNKTLITPADGQAGVGETVQYNLQIVNSGSTTLTNVSVTDNFPSNRLGYVSASLAPTTVGNGVLTWSNVGPLAVGSTTNIQVSFTATATTNSAVNSAVANAGGGTTNLSSVGVQITHSALTITKTLLNPTNGPVSIGSNVTFRIVVQNTGDTPIPTVPLEDTFSASCYSNVSATVTPDGRGAGSLLWNDITGAGSLATNASITIDVTMLVTGGCDPANNTAHADYAVDSHGDPVPPATSTIGITTGAARIIGNVYNDVDQTGTLTGGDVGLDNVTIELYSDPNGDGDPSDGSLLRLTATDTSGAYELLNLTTGAYVVVETDLPGFTSSFPVNNRLPLVLTTLATNANNNFFDYAVAPTNYATISGTVWADTNANGVVNLGEPGLFNVTIELIQDVNTNGLADSGETIAASTTTDASGAYSFVAVTPGHYVIRETDLYGWISTADSRPPNDNQIGLNVGPGVTTNGNDFLDFFAGNNPGNDTPVANNDVYSTTEDTPLTLSAPGILGNDTDVDGDMLTAVLVSTTTHGTLALNTNGGFTYTPGTNYSGSDAFTYRAYDGATNSGIATVNITVNPVNDSPVANNQFVVTPEDVSTNLVLAGSDVDGTIIFAILGNPAHGTLSGFNTNTGAVTYSPVTNYNGADSFTFTVYDGALYATGTVSITVTPVNDPPVANNQSVVTPEDISTNLVLTGSDTESAITFAILSGPAHGGLSGFNAGSGAVTYSPSTNYHGPDSFQFTVSDGSLTATGTVSITVTSVNDAPVAANDTANTTKNVPISVPVLVNDTDADGDPLTIINVSPTNGTAIISATNVVFTPATNFTGTATIGYTIIDGNGGTNSALITVNVSNTTPVANNDSYTTAEDTTLTVPASGVLTNDTDVDGDALTAVLVANVTHGALALNPNGGFAYTPATNYNGSDSFTYRANDGSATSAVATVTITIAPVNDAPIAVNDTTNTLEDVSVTISVLANDSDPEGTPLSIPGVTTTNGTAVISGTNVVFTPGTNFNGTVVLGYTISDGTNSASASITVIVSAVNDAPVANNDAFSTLKNVALNIPVAGVLTNDTDVENDSLSALLVANVTHGALTLNANGSFVYTPTSNYVGSDVFTYRAYDAGATGNVATVTLAILATNTAPVANNDSYVTAEDTVLIVPASGVLTNDTDVDGDALAAVLVTGPTHGSVTLNANGGFSYTPNTNYNGSDSFIYRANDGAATSAVATVSLTITPVNDAPVAVNDSATTPEDVVVTIPVLVNDSDVDGDTISIVSAVTTNGVVNVVGTNLVFTPATNFNGTTTLTYTITDGTTNASALVTVTVTPVNDAPVANNDAYSLFKNTTLTVPASGVLTNDSDVDGDPLVALLATGVTHGTLTLSSNGGFIYTPVSNYVGGDSFTYRANDGTTNSGLATVTLTIAATNTAPVAGNDSFTTAEDTVLPVPAAGVLTNDTDIDGDSLTAVLVTNPTHGTLTLNPNGGFLYTPATNYNGADSFTYRANDGLTNSGVATVSLTITPVNDAPVANNDSYATPEDTVLIVPASGVLTNDSDVDGDALTAVLVTGPTHGTLTLSTNGGFTYTPTNNYNGPDSFTYRASDGTTNSGLASVSLTITPVNDAPVAVNDTATTPEDVTVTIPVLINDSDVDNDPLSIVSAITTNGVVNVVGTNLVFTPATNFNGTVTLTYTITDGTTNASALVTVTVTPVNDAPVAINDAYSLFKNTTLTLPAAGVLTNDFDVDGNPLVALLATGVTHGTLTLSSNGGFIYTPVSNYVGGDSFTYRANDGTTNSGFATVTLTIAATNTAPIAVDDTYPAFSTAQLVVSAPGVLTNDTDADGDALTAVIASLPSHGTVTLNANGSFTYTPTNNYTGPDSFTYRANDGFTNSGFATVNVNVSPRADVVLVKTGAPSGAAGSNMTFTITVTNNGPSTASNVVVFDQLPAAYTFISAVPAAASVSNNLVRWPATNLPNASSAMFTVTASPTNGGVFTNIAYSTSSTVDLNPTNNDGSSTNSQVVSTVQPLADIAVFKTGSGSVVAGGSVNYTITVTNRGPSAATNVVVRDTLPAGVTFQSASSGFSLSNGVVSWTIPNFANGATSNYTVTVTAPASGGLTNIASSTAGTPDPTPGNNDGSSTNSQAPTTITPSADVAVFKTGATNVGSGATFIYTITVTNRGPSAATNVIVRDLLPTNLVFVGASAGGVFASNTVTWPTIASLPNGGTTNYTLTNTAPLNGSFTNKVTAMSATSDPDTSNNDGSSSGSQVRTFVIAGQFSLLAGPIVFNPQTGLFEQQATVTNTSGATVAGVQLLVGNIRGTSGVPRTNVFLYNASGTNADPRPYVQYNSPLNPAATVTFTLEFYVPDRKPFTNTLEAQAFIPSPAGTNAGAGVLIDRTFMDLRIAGSPRFVIEWASVPGKTYTIIYSDTGSAPWFVATPSVTANANRTQWYDDGPPKTASNPMSIPSRFYRVIVAP